MGKRSASYLFSRRQAFHSALVGSLILNAVLVMGIFYGRSRDFISEMHMGGVQYMLYFLWHFGCNVVLFFFLFLLNFRLVKSGSRHKMAVVVAGTLLICLILSPFLAQVQWRVLGRSPGLGMEGFLIFNLIKDLTVGGVVILFTNNLYATYKREQALVANQKLQQENIRIRYEALKNQLDPHFLFNSLNTLNGLIGFDDAKAHQYLDNLSSVFRYTLHTKTIVRLEEEMEFVDAYVEMLKIRFGDNMQVNYDVGEQYRDHYVMPASLQLLVENAVKHNIISNKYPLAVAISTTADGMVVVNNRVNPKGESTAGSGVGLANLTERYRILFRMDVKISAGNGVFSVAVPLLNKNNINPTI